MLFDFKMLCSSASVGDREASCSPAAGEPWCVFHCNSGSLADPHWSVSKCSVLSVHRRIRHTAGLSECETNLSDTPLYYAWIPPDGQIGSAWSECAIDTAVNHHGAPFITTWAARLLVCFSKNVALDQLIIASGDGWQFGRVRVTSVSRLHGSSLAQVLWVKISALSREPLHTPLRPGRSAKIHLYRHQHRVN